MNSKYFFAILLIAFGVGLLLDNLGVFHFGHIVGDWWPLLIVLWGIGHISSSNKSATGGIIITFIGLLLLGNSLDIIPSFWTLFWPLLLIFIGVWVLTAKKRSSKNRDSVATDEIIDQFTIFGGFEQRMEIDGLKGGSATAIFGGGKLDLRKCTLDSGTAELELNAFFGGMELVVPENWKVIAKGTPIFGGLENKTYPRINDDEIAPILKINYMAMFGGVEVKN